MRRLVGNQLHHSFKLRHSGLVLGILLEHDSEVEPGVRNFRILFLRLLEFRNPGGGFARRVRLR